MTVNPTVPFGVPSSLMWMLALRMFLTIRPGVLVVVNLPARIVLLMINLRTLLRREPAAVSCAVVTDFAVDICFAILNVAGLARCQFSRLYAIRDTSLLVRFALVDSAHCRGRRPAMIF